MDTLRREKGEGPPAVLLDQSQHNGATTVFAAPAVCSESLWGKTGEARDVVVQFTTHCTEPGLSQA